MSATTQPKRTPRKHFDEDIYRAEQMLRLAGDMTTRGEDERLTQDVYMSALTLGVGAMDAYFSDSYVDCLTKVLRAYVHGKWPGDLPTAYAKRELPAKEILDSSRENRPLWSLRMATRKIMERDNMLSISRVKDEFNGILPSSHKLWGGLVNELIACNYKKFTKVTQADTIELSGKRLESAKKKAIASFQERIGATVQLRHDWVHNCGRPKVAILVPPYGQVVARLKEVRAFVTAFDDHIQAHRLAQ